MRIELAANPVVLAIVGLALLCYVVELDLLLARQDVEWRRRAANWLKVLPILLSALPLLGLLGTIIGLLKTFRAMATSPELSQAFISQGIADALLTTQLGLMMVIPGLLLSAIVRRRYRELART